MSKPRFDWTGFCVNFSCGAVVGVLFGIWAFAKSPYAGTVSAWPGSLFIGSGALFCGLLAGFLGDAFWSSLGR